MKHTLTITPPIAIGRIVRLLACGVFANPVALLTASPATAAQPTRSLPRRPGGDGAVKIDAAKYDSLQAAIDALPAGGGLVEVPPGRFEIAEPLHVGLSDTALRGAGTSTHIVNTNTAGKPALLLSPLGNQKTKTNPRGSIWRVAVSDLRITGNPRSGPGVLARNVDEILLHRLAVEHNGKDGILLDHCYEDPRVSDCLINYNATTGLSLLGCHDIVVSANQFEENQDALHCIDGYNLTMTGNNLDDHLRDGVVIENTYGSVVAANMIEECNRHAIVLNRECYGDTISANVIAHHGGEGVRLTNVKDITITGNTFVLLARAAVHVLDGSAQITITGNGFCRYPFDPTKRHKLEPGCGVELESTSDITVSGNTFTGMKRSAVRAVGQRNSRLSITGNTVLNPSQDQPGAHPALSLQNVSDSIIANNILADTQETKTMKAGMIFEGTCRANVILGNQIRGTSDGGFAEGSKDSETRFNIVRP